jgi:hypothetical protein
MSSSPLESVGAMNFKNLYWNLSSMSSLLKQEFVYAEIIRCAHFHQANP